MQEGDVIDGRYRVEHKLGQGGMGQVFRGHDQELNKPVAIKVLFPNTSDQVIKRLHAEAKALAQLNHPNILTVHHFGQAKDGQLYLVTDFIKGESLQTVIEKRGAQTFFDVLPIFEKICRGLRFAHAKNILHRDIKPSNVMLASDRTKEDSVKLVDFGLAKQVDQDFDLTKTGSALGSPPYMSPETVHGKESDERSDIYSLGCTFFEMMVGRPPFVTESALQTRMAHVSRLPPTLAEASGKQFDEEVEEFIQKCLKKNPADRFKNMDEMIEELERVKNELLAKKELSLESLASGVYASGAFLETEMRKVDQFFKGTTGRVALIGTAVLIVAAFVVNMNSDKSVPVQAPAEQLSDLVHEVANPEDIENSGTVKVVQNHFSPEKVCKLRGRMTDARLKKAVKPYLSMKSFLLDELIVSDKSMKYLLELPIERLILEGMDLTDSRADEILRMPELKFLRMYGCGDIPVGFLERVKLKNLEALDIEPGKNYKHPGAVLADFKSLRSISIRNCNLDRSDIKALITGFDVIEMDFGGCKLSADAFTDLHQAKQCRLFECIEMQLTEKQIEQIAELPSLIALDLHSTNIDDRSLKKLHKCKNLRAVVLAGTSVTQAGAEVLKASVPGLKDIEMEKQLPVAELY